MALALPSSLLLVLLLLSCSSPSVLGGADELEYTLVALSSLKPKTWCSGYRVAPPQNITWAPLDHPHGPCSPLRASAAAAATPPPSLAELLHLDQLRADDIQLRLISSSDDNASSSIGETKPSRPAPSHTQTMNGKLTQGNVGSPRRGSAMAAAAGGSIGASAAGGGRRSNLPGVVQTFVLDSASDVPWVQCVPCPVPPCHPQLDTVYDPSRSATSAPFSCTSPSCTGLGPYANGCSNNGVCQYRVVYPVDGSSTSGDYIADLLTFDAANAVSGFKFGCSHAEQGGSLADPRAAGILALGGGLESLLSQTAARYGSVFSYCISPTPSDSGFFTIGVPRRAAFRYVVTPMVRFLPRAPTFYGVLLRGITVGGQPLAVSPAVFAAGSVLDSRTDITRLPPTAYRALRAAFRSGMSMYRLAPPKGILDTCYDFTGVVNVRLPQIKLVFDLNVGVVLDPSGVLYNGCLAFTAGPSDLVPGILGSVQQQTIEVLYNVAGGTVGFRQGAC